MHLKKLTFWQF